MDKYKQLYEAIEEAANKFKKWDKNKTIRIISHLDADGISAAAILIRLLNQENRKYSISILPQLNREKLIEFSKEKEEYFIFTDLGSGQLHDIKEMLKTKKILILDHHDIKSTELIDNIIHINPHLFGIDGSKEISGAGVVYLFASSIDKKNEELAYIAVIGAIGDVQEEKQGFLYLNNEILKIAVEKKKIKVEKGLRLFGIQTKPIHKVLEYSTDPYIPGVSGSESGAIQFLNQIGIHPKNGNDWKKIVQLDKEDMKKLVTGIIMNRLNEANPEDVLSNIYTLTEEEDGSPTRDAKEFATLLNACGRMNRASCGIGTCLGIKKDKAMAIQISSEYKKEIVNALRWYNENKDSLKIIKGKNYIILNAENNVLSTIIGTLASIISKSNGLAESTFIMSLARSNNGSTKISLRTTKTKKEVDLKGIIKKIIEKTGGEAGGHMQAAGAQIPTEIESEFIEEAQSMFDSL